MSNFLLDVDTIDFGRSLSVHLDGREIQKLQELQHFITTYLVFLSLIVDLEVGTIIATDLRVNIGIIIPDSRYERNL